MSVKVHEKPTDLPPLRPRRGLFYLFMGLFVMWLVALLGMYVTTVYPHPELDPHRRAGAARATATDR